MAMLVSSSKGWRKYFSDVASMAMMAMGKMGGVEMLFLVIEALIAISFGGE